MFLTVNSGGGFLWENQQDIFEARKVEGGTAGFAWIREIQNHHKGV